MLPKENRLTKRTEFTRVLEKGRVFQGPLFGLAVYKENSGAPPKAGVIISKKVSRLATKRNRGRRILRECLRRIIKEVKPGTLMVVLAKRRLVAAKKEEVERELERRLAVLIKQ